MAEEEVGRESLETGKKKSTVDVEVVLCAELRNKLMSVLKDGENAPVVDVLNDKHNGLLVTSPDDPKVVYESGAVPCAILVAYNEKGDAAVVHEPMTTNVAQKGELSQISVDVLRNLDATAIKYGSEAKVILSGMNVHNEVRWPTAEAIEAHLPSYRGKIEKRFTNNSGVKKPDNQMFGVTQEVYDGVCIVPLQMSVDGHTKIMIVSRNLNELPVSPADVLAKNRSETGGFGIELD